MSGLPKNWREVPAPPSLANLGSDWVRKRSAVGMRVPSAAVAQETSLLLNPAHADSARITVVSAVKLDVDPRLRR
jgi:RES domain-containing protein